MAMNCNGRTERNTHCGEILYKCPKCGTIGCRSAKCTNAKFADMGKCSLCGASGTDKW